MQVVDVSEQLVSWCFKPSQPQRIISGLRETFIKRYMIQRTNKAEQGQKNRVRKRRVVGRIYGMKYSWKGQKNSVNRLNLDDGTSETELVQYALLRELTEISVAHDFIRCSNYIRIWTLCCVVNAECINKLHSDRGVVLCSLPACSNKPPKRVTRVVAGVRKISARYLLPIEAIKHLSAPSFFQSSSVQ